MLKKYKVVKLVEIIVYKTFECVKKGNTSANYF